MMVIGDHAELTPDPLLKPKQMFIQNSPPTPLLLNEYLNAIDSAKERGGMLDP